MARDLTLVDPLSEVTRKERRMLLGLSVVSVFIIETGAVPTKISALGIEFGYSDQQAFLWLLAAVLFYFTAAFTAYASSDFVAWRKEIFQTQIDGVREYWSETYRPEPDSAFEATVRHDEEVGYRKNRVWFSLTKPVSIFRSVFEFLLPLVVGVVTVCAVVVKACAGG